MVQELFDLRASIATGCYEDALAIIDDLEGMSKQAIIRNIESFLIRMIVHLVKNQVEERLTNSWAASIADSLRQINKFNLKDNKKYYSQTQAYEVSPSPPTHLPLGRWEKKAYLTSIRIAILY